MGFLTAHGIRGSCIINIFDVPLNAMNQIKIWFLKIFLIQNFVFFFTSYILSRPQMTNK